MSHDVKEVNVLDGTITFPVILLHEAKHFLLFDVKSKSTHGYLEFMVINSAGLISVKEVESLLDLLLLLFSELSSLTAFAFGRLHLHLLAGFLLSKEVRFLVHFGFKLYIIQLEWI